MESAITSTLTSLILEAKSGNEGLSNLLKDDSLLDLLKEVSNCAARTYGGDKDDIRQALWIKVSTEIGSLKEPGSIRWWLTITARNEYFNWKRDHDIEDLHCNTVASDNSEDEQSQTESKKDPKASQPPEPDEHKKPPRILFANEVLRSTVVQNPEQQLVEVELAREEALVKEQQLKQLRGVISRFPEKIVTAWSKGLSPKEISEEAGVSVKTVYRTLREMGRAACLEFGTDPDAPGCSLALKRALYP